MLLELKQITKIYHVGSEDFAALHDINLSIKEKAFLSFVGPSGSGKTTMLNLIGGLDLPTSGKIILNGMDLGQLSRSELAELRREKIGFIFQTHNLFPV